MDVKKFVQMSFSVSNFTDEEVNRIMQDEPARKSFMMLMVTSNYNEAYLLGLLQD